MHWLIPQITLVVTIHACREAAGTLLGRFGAVILALSFVAGATQNICDE
jgi:hypothetical protein